MTLYPKAKLVRAAQPRPAASPMPRRLGSAVGEMLRIDDLSTRWAYLSFIFKKQVPCGHLYHITQLSFDVTSAEYVCCQTDSSQVGK